MRAVRLETTVSDKGELQLGSLPFQPGEEVEVIILSRDVLKVEAGHFPLAGTVLRYDDPTEPVAEGDWDALR